METGYLEAAEKNSILTLTIVEQNQFQVCNTPSTKPKWLEEKVESMVQNKNTCKDFLNKA